MWKQLPAADRRRMCWLARRGRPEPDHRVAEIGVAWAEAVLAPRTKPPGSRLERVPGFLLSLVTGDFGADAFGERWIARKILHANHPAEPLSRKELWQAVHAALLDEIEFRVGPEALTIEPDELGDYTDHLADAIVGRFEVLPPSKSPVNQDRAIWQSVHTALLDELASRAESAPLTIEARSEPLTIEASRIGELVDRLTGVIIGRFELVPRPPL